MLIKKLIIFSLVGFNVIGLLLIYQESGQLVDFQNRYSGHFQLGSQDFSPILQAFANEEKVIEFVSLFEGFSLSFKSDFPLTDKTQPYLPLVLVVSGPTKEVLGFVKQLLASFYLLEISSLEMKSEDNFVNQAELVINANLYVDENF